MIESNENFSFSLQVNGIDVSSFPHEDAVQVFLSAPEPIVVELKRRTTSDSINSSTTSSRSSDANSIKSPQFSTIAVQTDTIGTYTGSTGHRSSGFIEQHEFLYDESPTSDHPDPDDECLPPDIDIEVKILSLFLSFIYCFKYIFEQGLRHMGTLI